MSEIGGSAELKILQADVAITKKAVESVKAAEPVEGSCEKILASIQKAENKDGFIVKEGAAVVENAYHTAAATPAEGGCCIIL
jgi:hypothetical protein